MEKPIPPASRLSATSPFIRSNSSPSGARAYMPNTHARTVPWPTCTAMFKVDPACCIASKYPPKSCQVTWNESVYWEARGGSNSSAAP